MQKPDDVKFTEYIKNKKKCQKLKYDLIKLSKKG